MRSRNVSYLWLLTPVGLRRLRHSKLLCDTKREGCLEDYPPPFQCKSYLSQNRAATGPIYHELVAVPPASRRDRHFQMR